MNTDESLILKLSKQPDFDLVRYIEEEHPERFITFSEDFFREEGVGHKEVIQKFLRVVLKGKRLPRIYINIEEERVGIKLTVNDESYQGEFDSRLGQIDQNIYEFIKIVVNKSTDQFIVEDCDDDWRRFAVVSKSLCRQLGISTEEKVEEYEELRVTEDLVRDAFNRYRRAFEIQDIDIIRSFWHEDISGVAKDEAGDERKIDIISLSWGLSRMIERYDLRVEYCLQNIELSERHAITESRSVSKYLMLGSRTRKVETVSNETYKWISHQGVLKILEMESVELGEN